MALTNTQIKAVKPRTRDFKMADGGGMYLLVKAKGSKYWRLDYRFRGKRNTLALGVYSGVSLKDAGKSAGKPGFILRMIATPAETRKEEKRVMQVDDFEAVTHQWKTV